MARFAIENLVYPLNNVYSALSTLMTPFKQTYGLNAIACRIDFYSFAPLRAD